jgi:hypothetical protein
VRVDRCLPRAEFEANKLYPILRLPPQRSQQRIICRSSLAVGSPRGLLAEVPWRPCIAAAFVSQLKCLLSQSKSNNGFLCCSSNSKGKTKITESREAEVQPFKATMIYQGCSTLLVYKLQILYKNRRHTIRLSCLCSNTGTIHQGKQEKRLICRQSPHSDRHAYLYVSPRMHMC